MGDEGRFVDLVVVGAPAGLAVIDIDGRCRWHNPAFARLVGHTTITGRTVAELTHPDDRHTATRLGALVAARRRRFAVHHRFQHADGHPVPVVTVAELAHDPGGRPSHYVTLVLADEAVTEAARQVDSDAHRLNGILTAASEYSIVATDSAGSVTLFSAGAERLLGYRAGDVIGHATPALWRGANWSDMLDRLHSTPPGEYVTVTGVWVRRADGTVFQADISATPLFGSDATMTGTVSIARDVTAERALQQRLDLAARHAEARLGAVLHGLGTGVFDYDPATRTAHVNDAYATIVGLDRHDLSADDLLAVVHPDDRERVAGQRASVEHGEHDSPIISYRVVRPDGTVRWVRSFAQRVTGADTDVHVVGVLVDDTDQHTTAARLTDLLTEADAVRAQLAHQSVHDPLTGLPNRVLFLDALTHILARHAGRDDPPVAVLFCDLDRFKIVNDSLGHPAGDQLVADVADRLRDAARPGDLVARFGGDEFVILCDDVDRDTARHVARHLLDALRGPYVVAGRTLVASASIGVATATATSSAADLLRDADAAMYVAKTDGRDRVAVFDDATRRSVVVRLELEDDLRHAIDAVQLTLHYQPAFRFDGAVASLEALVRWQHPSRGLVLPGDFIPVAEETGLIVDVGRWVRRTAAGQIARWQGAGLTVPPVWVNLSAAEMAAGDVTADLQELAATYDLPPGALGVELTESTLLAVSADQTLARVRAAGFPVALDDFGTGFSSLTYLRRHRVDLLKIDRSFVSGLPEERDAASIVAAVVDLAHGLGARTVAEGVETAEQHTALAGLGCDAAQGFWLARPSPPDTIAGLLAGTPA